MPFIIADRVQEVSTTVGTGNITLAGAVVGYQTFDSVLNTGDTTYYTFADQAGGPNWEVGIGTFTAPATLARTTILSSSNGGSVVNFTAGTKTVFISQPASKTNVNDQPNVIAVNSPSAALRITQNGPGYAILIEDEPSTDSTPFAVTSTGQLLVGTAVGNANSEVVVANKMDNSTAATIELQKDRAGSPVSNGDGLGGLVFEGYDGTLYEQGAAILASVDGTPGPINLPTNLSFFTRQESAGGMTLRMRISSQGYVGIGNSSPAASLDVFSLSGDDAVRITQTGSGNALVVEDSANPDSSPFVINTAGQVMIGRSTAPFGTTLLGIERTTADTTAAIIDLLKNRGGTPVAPVVSGDALGAVRFWGFDGTANQNSASITSTAEGTITTGDVPGRIVFSTRGQGSGSVSERMRIDSEGRVGIGSASLTNQRLRVQYTISDTTSTAVNSLFAGTHDLSANNTFTYTAADNQAALNQGAFNQTTSLASGGGIRGARSFVTVTGASGTVTGASGFLTDIRNTGAGTLTNAAGFLNGAIQNTGGGTLTNAYGFYTVPLAAASNNFGFYSDVAAGVTRTITNVARTSNVVTITTSAAHGYLANQSVTVTATTNTGVNGTFVITSVPTTTTFTYAQVGADIPSVADTGSAVVVGRWNFYANGTADNYFAGSVVIGKTITNSRFNVAATDNLTTNYPIRVDNLSNNYGAGYGAYGMSNRVNPANLSVDYTIDIGRNLFIRTANVEVHRITQFGQTQLTATGTGGVTGNALTVTGTNLSGATTNTGISVASTFGLGATVRGIGVQTTIATEAGGAGLAAASGFRAVQGTFGTAVTNQYGYWADSTLTGGTNNFGFYSDVAAGTGRWNFYANGTASNYFNGNVGIGNVNPLNKLDVTGSFGRGAPVTKTGNFTLADIENWIICNGAGTITVTFPAASAWTGREVMLKTIAAQTVVSASSNVVPLAGGAAGTAILPATAGAWATLVSDGTNWIIMQA